jgi:hypothetical protein
MSEMGLHDPFEYWKHKLCPKESRELKCQFDSWPLKVTNRLDLLACRWHAIYHWKALNEGYNFVLNLTSIEGLHKKLWASKVVRVPILRISGLLTCESLDKMILTLPSPHPKALASLSTPKVLQAKECTPTFYSFDVFTFWIHSWVHQGV